METEELKLLLINGFKKEESSIQTIMLKTDASETCLDGTKFVEHKQFQCWDHRLRMNVNTIKVGGENKFQINFDEAIEDGYPNECEELGQINGILHYRELVRVMHNKIHFRLRQCELIQRDFKFSLDLSINLKYDDKKNSSYLDFVCIFDCDTGNIEGKMSAENFIETGEHLRSRCVEYNTPYMDFGFNQEILDSFEALAKSCVHRETATKIQKVISDFKNTNYHPMLNRDISPMLYLLLELTR